MKGCEKEIEQEEVMKVIGRDGSAWCSSDFPNAAVLVEGTNHSFIHTYT